MSGNIMLLLDEKFFPAAAELIKSAEKEILVSSFKFEHSSSIQGRTIAELFRILCEAAQHGCSVKVLVNSVSGKSKLMAINKAAVRILTQAGCQPRALPGTRTAHAKLLIADGKKMILGSHNWTARSLSSNFEMSLLVDDPDTLAYARIIFYRLWDSSKPF